MAKSKQVGRPGEENVPMNQNTLREIKRHCEQRRIELAEKQIEGAKAISVEEVEKLWTYTTILRLVNMIERAIGSAAQEAGGTNANQNKVMDEVLKSLDQEFYT